MRTSTRAPAPRGMHLESSNATGIQFQRGASHLPWSGQAMKALWLNSWSYPSRTRWLTLLLLIFGLALACVLARYIVAADLTSLAFVAMMAAGATVAAIILRNWRDGTYLLMAWLLFEDFARKFLGNSMTIYFAKDILVLLVYLSLFVEWRRRDSRLTVFRPPFLIILLTFIWFGTLQV